MVGAADEMGAAGAVAVPGPVDSTVTGIAVSAGAGVVGAAPCAAGAGVEVAAGCWTGGAGAQGPGSPYGGVL
ncbi:hypothetical protein [Streptomyces zaehneri]|uniref:hypothetical protein n=1 Tax=Streptomyces zaehneri TaxID=3051180 RepID=UPI0037DA574A